MCLETLQDFWGSGSWYIGSKGTGKNKQTNKQTKNSEKKKTKKERMGKERVLLLFCFALFILEEKEKRNTS